MPKSTLFPLSVYAMMLHMHEPWKHGAGSAHRRLSVKRHPVVLVRNFLALQFASAGLYLGAGSLVHFARLWRGLPLVGYYLPFSFVQAGFIFGAEVALIIYIFLSWYRTDIHVYDRRVVVAGGVIRRTKRTYDITPDMSVVMKQNPVGRLTKYGSVIAGDADSGWRLNHIPEPWQFVRAIRGAAGERRLDEDPVSLLARAEDGGLEFKSSLRWDVRTRKVNRALEKAAVKTVAAFLNSQGGHLVLGVSDDRSVHGLEHDIGTLQRKDKDGFEIHMSNLFNSMIGAHLRSCLSMTWAEHEGKPFCVLSVAPAAEPAFVRADNTEEFFVRTGNGTTSLTVSQVPAYLKTRFRN